MHPFNLKRSGKRQRSWFPVVLYAVMTLVARGGLARQRGFFAPARAMRELYEKQARRVQHQKSMRVATGTLLPLLDAVRTQQGVWQTALRAARKSHA